ncbi:hypothetical protein BHE74_00010352 [Ensete ventricosum]|nr:hypothetical protein BHE74_00010352 [Ensete ventricosum]
MAIPRRTINVTQKTNPEPHGGAEPTPRKDHTQNAIENPTAVPNHRTPPTLEETHPILPDCSPIRAPTSPFGVTPLGPGPRFCICKGPPVVGGDAVGWVTDPVKTAERKCTVGVHRLVPEATRGAATPVLSAVNPYLPSAGPL